GRQAEAHQLVARPERAVEEDARRAVEALDPGAEGARGGAVDDAPAIGPEIETDVVFRRRVRVALGVYRKLAGKRERRHRQPAWKRGRTVERERMPGDLTLEPLQRPEQDVALAEAAPHRRGRIQVERIRLAQREEPEHVIEVPVGEDDRRDR